MTTGLFVGREFELQRLRDAFDAAIAGKGSAAMLAGEPGIGKTRLARELERYALDRGAHVLWGPTHEAGGAPPYWPWVQVGNAWGSAVDLLGAGLSRLERSRGDLGELARVLPVLRGAPGYVEPADSPDAQAAQFLLFDAFTRFVRSQSRDTPWLVVLDDLHWADKATLQLLSFLGRGLSEARVLIVGTYRDSQLTSTHPLTEVL